MVNRELAQVSNKVEERGEKKEVAKGKKVAKTRLSEPQIDAEARETKSLGQPNCRYKDNRNVLEEQGSHGYNAVKMQIFTLNPPILT